MIKLNVGDEEVSVLEYSLLSLADYVHLKWNIDSVDFAWWLLTRSAKGDVYVVEPSSDVENSVYLSSPDSELAVRPVLYIKACSKNIGYRFKTKTMSWKFIGKTVILADSPVFVMPYTCDAVEMEKKIGDWLKNEIV